MGGRLQIERRQHTRSKYLVEGALEEGKHHTSGECPLVPIALSDAADKRETDA